MGSPIPFSRSIVARLSGNLSKFLLVDEALELLVLDFVERGLLHEEVALRGVEKLLIAHRERCTCRRRRHGHEDESAAQLLGAQIHSVLSAAQLLASQQRQDDSTSRRFDVSQKLSNPPLL